jgi:hypothetical protein
MVYYCLQIEHSTSIKSKLQAALATIFCRKTNFRKLGKLFVKELCEHNASDTNFSAHVAAISYCDVCRITIYSSRDIPANIWGNCTTPLRQCKDINSACIRSQQTDKDGKPDGIARGGAIKLDLARKN